MRQKITAFFLSALVFPGLGQLYKQDRKKGILLILTANMLLGLLLLMGLILLSREYYAVFYPKPLTREILGQLCGDILSHPLFLIPFTLLVGLWAYGAVDAARSAGNIAAPEGK